MSGGEAGWPFWASDAAALAARLESGLDGLSSAEAARRLRRTGPNALDDAEAHSGARLLLRQFESPLVIILVFAAAVALILRDWADAGIILAIVLGSTLLGFSQEYRASNAIQRLKKRLALTNRVLRDGAESPNDERSPASV